MYSTLKLNQVPETSLLTVLKSSSKTRAPSCTAFPPLAAISFATSSLLPVPVAIVVAGNSSKIVLKSNFDYNLTRLATR